MNSLFIGFLFIFLNFNINLGQATIGLIPAFIGFIFLLKGINELSSESPHFQKAKPLSIFMVLYSAFLYILDILAITNTQILLTIFLGIINMITSLYICYIIISGVKDIEETRNAFLNSNKLRSRWNLMVLFQSLSILSVLILPMVVIFVIVLFIITILFLIDFHGTKKLYESLT